jgi:hypothetical protein
MRLGLTVFATMIMFSLFSISSLSVSDLFSDVNSLDYNQNERYSISYYPDRTSIPQALMDNTQVEIVKSFKNSSGFYKINGTLENQGVIMLSDIKVIKYYKIPSVNDTTLVCYELDIINCQYKSIDNQLPSKNLFLTMPPAPPETNISSN